VTGGLLPAVGLSVAAALAALSGEEVTRFADHAIVESSGLVAQGDRFLTVNDSGDTGRVFVVDARTGRTLRTVNWTPDPVDVEALAPAAGDAVWVGDIGDNLADRESVQLALVPFDGSAVSVYAVRYPDGPADAETLLRHPDTGQLFVVTKSVFGGRLLAAPNDLAQAPAPGPPRVLEDLGSVAGLVTDGAFFPDGRHLIVRNYTRAFVYAFPTLDPVGAFDLPDQEQGEGLAVAGPDTVYLSSEGVAAPILRLSLPEQLRADLQAPTDPEAPAVPEQTASPPAAPLPSPGAAAAETSSGRGVPRTAWLLLGAGVCGGGLLVAGLRRRR
jgi:hypothetical protein